MVPGVLILSRVIRAADNVFGRSVCAVPLAKFHSRLKPDADYTVRLERTDDAHATFSVLRADETIASGSLHLTAK